VWNYDLWKLWKQRFLCSWLLNGSPVVQWVFKGCSNMAIDMVLQPKIACDNFLIVSENVAWSSHSVFANTTYVYWLANKYVTWNDILINATHFKLKTIYQNLLVTLYNKGALICISSCLTNAQIILN